MKIKNRQPVPEKYWDYENHEHGFRISYPSTWTKLENLEKAVVAFLRPEKGLMKKPFYDNINISIIQLPSADSDLEHFVMEDIDKNLKGLIPQFNLLKNTNIEMAGYPAYELIYTGSQKKKRPVQWLQVLVKRDTRVYVITCACSPERFEAFEKTARTILDTFVFIESPAIDGSKN